MTKELTDIVSSNNESVLIRSESSMNQEGSSNTRNISNEVKEFRARLLNISEAVSNITEQVKLVNNSSSNTHTNDKEKMVLFTELFNEVHQICSEIRQITSQIREIKDMNMEEKQMHEIDEAEQEINRVLEELSHLKTDLHERISSFIVPEDVQDKGLVRTTEEIVVHDYGNKSEIDTEISFITDKFQTHVSTDSGQLQFISEYISTMTKNVEEIKQSLQEIPTNYGNCRDLKDKIRDVKILERHLKRNEPLVKEVEFWLYHDFAHSSEKKEGGPVEPLKEQFNQLCEILSKTIFQLHSIRDSLEFKLNQFQPREEKKNKQQFSNSSSDEPQGGPFEPELKHYRDYCKEERRKLLNDIKIGESLIPKISKVLDEINQTLDDNRYVSVTNDALVAQQCQIIKDQQELLKSYQKDFDWLVTFSDAIKLCKTEVPDKIFYEIYDLKIDWNNTKDRISHALEKLSKVRKYWILFEYYTVRVILWNKAYVLNNQSKTPNEWKSESDAIQKKVKRVKKIINALSGYIGEFSHNLIVRLWDDTHEQFKNISSKL